MRRLRNRRLRNVVPLREDANLLLDFVLVSTFAMFDGALDLVELVRQVIGLFYFSISCIVS